MRTTVIVNFQIDGVHSWPDCDIEQVEYLRNIHRHVFHITCEKEVTHDDRDIEIIRFKHGMYTWMRDQHFDHKIGCCNFVHASCEMLAKRLLERYDLEMCQVLEDNENGARVYK